MTLCIDTQLTLRDLETYIKVQLDDPRYSEVAMDPILDIILHAKKRLVNGDYMPRVVAEAMIGLDEYLMVYADCETCSI